MSFFAPWMKNIKLDVEDKEVAVKDTRTKEEIEIEEAKKLIERIENCDMISADRIKEYRSAKKRLKLLIEEEEYKEWFKDNRIRIGIFFDKMRNNFLGTNTNVYRIYYYIPTDSITTLPDIINGEEMFLSRKFLQKLLERYGFKCEITEQNRIDNKNYKRFNIYL